MLIRFLLMAFCLSMMIASAKANVIKGIEFYNQRHEGANGTSASKINIDKAIFQFTQSITANTSDKEAALYLLKSYYYRGEFATQNIEEKKEIFNKGKSIGEEFIEKFPNSYKLRYWYLVNLGSWAQVYGTLNAAREGVADLMKTHSEKIIELNSDYSDGGGYFMLGAVHYKSPYIPFLLSWPDNDEAIKFLELAVNTGKAELNQKNYLAKALNKAGKTKKARTLLNEVISTKINPENYVEDFDRINEAKEILESL